MKNFCRIDLAFKAREPILAFGSQTKNTVCFIEKDKAFVSSVKADLDNPQDRLSFEEEAKKLIKKHPKILAYDLHPGYYSSEYAVAFSARKYVLSPIQHHHAHIASCMAENFFTNQRVIGVAFDGTGLGVDGKIWGGEFLVGDYSGFSRRAHVREVLLLGGESAVLEPARLVFYWLRIMKQGGISYIMRKIGYRKVKYLEELYQKHIYSYPASSMGRLFDAVAALIMRCSFSRFEGELPMRLESLALAYQAGLKEDKRPRYKLNIIKGRCYIIDPVSLFKALLIDIKKGVPHEEMAYYFHQAVALLIKNMSIILREETGIRKVVLSGGVFQNRLLFSMAEALLRGNGFSVYSHNKLSASDSSLSLGQAAVANFRGKICV